MRPQAMRPKECSNIVLFHVSFADLLHDRRHEADVLFFIAVLGTVMR